MQVVSDKKVIPTKQSKYPCLGELTTEGNRKGIVVLFNGPKRGMIIFDPRNIQTGYCSTSWIEHEFKPFEGTLKLKN